MRHLGNSIFTLMSAALLTLSCTDSANSPALPPDTVTMLSALENVPMQLSAASVDSRNIDLTPFRPFKLIVGDSTIWGNDGCNEYWFKFQLKNDSIFLQGGGTLAGCIPTNPIANDILCGQWNLAVAPGIITLRRPDSLLQFTSEYTLPLRGYPFVDRAYTLSASDDSIFSICNYYNYLPSITLNKDHEYLLRWASLCGSPPSDTVYSKGVYGIGLENRISIQERDSRFCTPDTIPLYYLSLWGFDDRITSSSSITLTDSAFTFVNHEAGFFYSFVYK